MNDIMKIIKALENLSILLKGVSKTIENETKEQKGGFLSMLLGTLGTSLLGNISWWKRYNACRQWNSTCRVWK